MTSKVPLQRLLIAKKAYSLTKPTKKQRRSQLFLFNQPIHQSKKCKLSRTLAAVLVLWHQIKIVIKRTSKSHGWLNLSTKRDEHFQLQSSLLKHLSWPLGNQGERWSTKLLAVDHISTVFICCWQSIKGDLPHKQPSQLSSFSSLQSSRLTSSCSSTLLSICSCPWPTWVPLAGSSSSFTLEFLTFHQFLQSAQLFQALQTYWKL